MKYSNELKTQAVNNYINGIKLKDIAIKYNIKANSSILDWYQKYHESSEIKVFDRKNVVKPMKLDFKIKLANIAKRIKNWKRSFLN
ncbi:transposase [Spiroplasma endosymbiont of Dioctria linearis]|uniref:transposase n=1 Tax=Spiroplasma endosymbiont of Dioctria linearis TaxID=3066290 RepID=UPI00313BD2D0